MSAAPVKIPLSVKKDVKDNEAKKAEFLAEIEKSTGLSPITFNYDLNTLYAGLEGMEHQVRAADWAVNQYLKNMTRLFAKGCEDAMIKQELAEKWTTKNINIVIVPDDYDTEKHPDKGCKGYTNACHARMKDGEFQAIFRKARFGAADDLWGMELKKVLAQSPQPAGAISLDDRVKLRDAQKAMDQACEDIGKALGTEKFTADLEADWKACMEQKPTREVNLAWLPGYYTNFAGNVKRHAQDDLWKQTAAARFSKRKVALKLVPDLYDAELLKGDYQPGERSGAYCGVQVLDGVVYICCTPKTFCANIDNIWGADMKQLFKAEAGALSPAQQVQIRDNDKKIKETVAAIETATGVSPVTWDLKADTLAIQEAGIDRAVVDAQLQYVASLKDALVSQLKEEMLKEAVADEFTAKRVGVKVVADVAAMKALPMCASGCGYNGIQIADGGIWVVVPKDKWFTNVDSVGYEHKLLPLF